MDKWEFVDFLYENPDVMDSFCEELNVYQEVDYVFGAYGLIDKDTKKVCKMCGGLPHGAAVEMLMFDLLIERGIV